jgi:hypothetical protein
MVAAGAWLGVLVAGCSSSANGSAYVPPSDAGGGASPDATLVDEDAGSPGVPSDGAPGAAADASDAGRTCTADAGPQTFTCTGSMATARNVPGGATLPNGKVLVAGGWNPADGVIVSAELYDAASGVFTRTGSMATGHLWAGWGAMWPLVGEQVLAAGGLDSSGIVTAQAELFDPGAGVFAPTRPMAVGAISMAPVSLSDGSVLFVGGWDAVLPQTKAELPSWSYIGSGTSWAQTFKLDPEGGTFAHTGDLSGPRLFGCNVPIAGGALAIGGADGPAAIESSIQRFAVDSGAWTTVGSLVAGTFCARAFALPNGQVLLTGTGGLTAATSALPGMLLFDPATNATSLTKNALSNFSPNLVQLASGDVLAFGGTLSGGPTAVAQVYVAATNTWHTVGPMTQPRSGAVGAYLLASGDVLIAGGEDASGAPLATAEIYHP